MFRELLEQKSGTDTGSLQGLVVGSEGSDVEERAVDLVVPPRINSRDFKVKGMKGIVKCSLLKEMCAPVIIMIDCTPPPTHPEKKRKKEFWGYSGTLPRITCNCRIIQHKKI